MRIWRVGQHEVAETILRERRAPPERVTLEEPGGGSSIWTVVSVEQDPHGWRTTATRCLPGCTEHPGMNDELSDRHAYRVIAFEERLQAEAFAAALSRFLNGPEGGGYRSSGGAEIWLAAGSGSVDLWLGSAAFEAARSTFSPLPPARIGQARDLPAGSKRMSAESIDP